MENGIKVRIYAWLSKLHLLDAAGVGVVVVVAVGDDGEHIAEGGPGHLLRPPVLGFLPAPCLILPLWMV